MYSKFSNSPTLNPQNSTYKTHPNKPPAPSTSPTKPSPSSIILNRSISQDGHYKIISRTLEGEDLKEAVLLEYHINAKGKK
jgi:hypothetical protein